MLAWAAVVVAVWVGWAVTGPDEALVEVAKVVGTGATTALLLATGLAGEGAGAGAASALSEPMAVVKSPLSI